MSIRKTLFSMLALAIFSSASVHADDVGVDFPAASYDFESAPDDQFVIQDMGDKVGYIIADPVQTQYWGYDSFDFGAGATSLTVRASSATGGGTLTVRLMNQNNPSLTVARIDIPNTGGWDQFQDFTVPINSEVIDWFGTNSPSLYFVVEQNNNPGYLFDVQSFRFDNENEGVLLGSDFVLESYPSDDFVIRRMGNRVGYITDFSWLAFTMVDVPDGTTSLSLSASSNTSGGTVYVTTRAPYNFGGTVVATIDIGNTGGWDQFQEFSANVESPIEGRLNRLFLSFEGDDAFLFDIEALYFNN